MSSPDLARLIRDVPDYPTPGIVFKDVTPLLADARGFDAAVTRLVAPFARTGIDHVVGIESRGFIFGGAAARILGAGFVPVRKPGKLPRDILRRTYALEYGEDAVEMHADALAPNQRVLIVDDVVATGGTLAATIELIREAGARVAGAAVLIELAFLEARKRLPADLQLHGLLRY